MGLLFLAPGYLFARATNIASFHQRSAAEKFLWSLATSFPLAISLCALGGRILSSHAIEGIFLALNVIACALVVPALRRGRARTPDSTVSRGFFRTRTMFLFLALFGLYCIAALTDIQVGHRLYVSTVIADWSVRVPMVEAAMRSAAAGVVAPPINGLSTLTAAGFGHAPHLRYYYFWYVLVAQVAQAFHFSAHATLIASCAWAGWGLIATAFLALKYVLALGTRLRRSCFLLLLIGGVLGLDILPTALLWLSPKLHPYPEMEYWHQDRTPSFLGAVLYAPHHIAAFCALLAGFLALLVTSRAVSGRTPELRQTIGAALLAGIAFAAGAGTSLFPTFCFVFVLSLWAIDLLRRRDFRTVAALAASGILAVLLARPYLHDLASTSSAASGFANLAWRNDPFLALQEARHHILTSHPVLALLARQPMVLVMDFFDLGFYTLVLIAGVRALLARGRRSAGQTALAALIAGAAIPAFFLTSTATSGPNDLGVDAGFLLRFGLQLAAVPFVWTLWQQRQTSPETRPSRLLFRFAATLFALGLSAQLYQAVSERLYYPVIGPGFAHKQIDSFTHDHLAARLYNIREAYRTADQQLAPSQPDTNAIQFNPVGPYQPAETLYAGRQVASWDTGCGTSYGGEYTRCAPAFANLLFLFGNTQPGVDAGRAENDRQDNAATRTATLADFEATCRTLHVAAIVAESTDSIWQRPHSWVWTAPVLTANETVRILRCPTT